MAAVQAKKIHQPQAGQDHGQVQPQVSLGGLLEDFRQQAARREVDEPAGGNGQHVRGEMSYPVPHP